MEPWLEDLHVSAERLVDSELGCRDLKGWRSATAANAGAPHLEAASEVPTTHQAGFVASAFVLLDLLVFEVVFVDIIDQLMLLHGNYKMRVNIVAMKKVRHQA